MILIHDHLPSFCPLPSEVAVLFVCNLRSLPFLQYVIDFDLLCCSGVNLEDADLFLCLAFTQRPMNDQKIDRSNEMLVGL